MMKVFLFCRIIRVDLWRVELPLSRCISGRNVDYVVIQWNLILQELRQWQQLQLGVKAYAHA